MFNYRPNTQVANKTKINPYDCNKDDPGADPTNCYACLLDRRRTQFLECAMKVVLQLEAENPSIVKNAIAGGRRVGNAMKYNKASAGSSKQSSLDRFKDDPYLTSQQG